MDAPPPIVLTTDFGLNDPYVGIMKGVILNINPRAVIADLTHQVQPQNLRQAAFVLGSSFRFFPSNSIHVAVVDPGVGTERRAILLLTPEGRFLAPDNGVLSQVLSNRLESPTDRPGLVPIPGGCTVYQLTNPQYWLHPMSNTFHGRDIFAPVAAHLSLGVSPDAIGSPVSGLVWLPGSMPSYQSGYIQGEVIYIDHFGNLITNIPGQQLAGFSKLQVQIKGRRITRLSQTFHDGDMRDNPNLLALIGSHGHLEIAVRDGSAAITLGAGPGEPVLVYTDEGRMTKDER
jgi:S-adenosyl-L-methionine hydrolase (adenosine-forming)